jgi:thioredoxin-related protein
LHKTNKFKALKLLAVIAMGIALIIPRGLNAAELVLFETAGCAWCEAWHNEIGGIYHLTDEAKFLRLRRVEIADPMPHDLRHIHGISFTPTFVVLLKNRELGRIEGFSSQDQFWGLLGEIIKNNRAALMTDRAKAPNS